MKETVSAVSFQHKEPWARGAQWELTRMVYPNYLGRERATNAYTLVVADMIDNATTERTNWGYGSRSWDGTEDRVSGYTIRQIEDALIDTKTWSSWRDKIISKYNNPTESHLTTLFEAYE